MSHNPAETLTLSPDEGGSVTPPHSLDAERSVLGGLMLDHSRWDQIVGRVTEEDFYRREHRLIFQALAALCDTGVPLDVVTVSEWLGKNGELSAAGGLSYLGQIANNTPSAANIVAYANIVHDHGALRRLIRAASDITRAAYSPEGKTASDVIDQAEKTILDVREDGLRGAKGFTPINALLSASIDRIEALFKSDSKITGVPTGFQDLDVMTSGLQPGDLVIVAGRPAMGKTALALAFAEHAATRHGDEKCPVGIFSMEMSGEQLTMRLLSSIGHIDATRLRTGDLQDEDWTRLTRAIGVLHDAPIHIDDTPDLTPFELRSRARRLKQAYGLGLIVVDYLQLMRATESGENRATEVAGITRSLKSLAKELHVPIVALSQLNRSLEQRPNKRPVLSDLRESGGIEQDADVVLFIYRDEIYNDDSPDKGTAEIIVRKQRNGPTGEARLTFLGQYTRFENHAAERAC